MKIDKLKFDKRNANKGTQIGGSLLEKSISKNGLGRSVLVDKDFNLIAGNKTTETAGALGLDNCIVVDTDGTKLVVVRRTDVAIDSKKGRELAISDNQVSKMNLDFDIDVIQDLAVDFDIDVNEWGLGDFDSININMGNLSDDFSLKSGDREQFQQMTFTLADEQAVFIKNAISDISKTDEYKYMETMGNANANGNALYLIITKWQAQKT